MRARKIDSNTHEMVAALKKLGIRVWNLNEICDLILAYNGYVRLAEVRPADKKAEPREGRQQKFHDEFPVYWLQTVDDCIACAESMKLHARLLHDGIRSQLRGGGQLHG